MPHFWLSFSLLFCFCSPFFISSSASSLSSFMASPSNKNSTNNSAMPPAPPVPTSGGRTRYFPKTTFIRTDPENFKAMVQKFTAMIPTASRVRTTAATIAAPAPSRPAQRFSSIGLGPRKPAAFKLHERRPSSQNVMNTLEITRSGGGISCEKFMASPVSPFQLLGIGSPTNSSTPTLRSANSAPAPPLVDEELRQIPENGFYLSPCPREGSKRPRPLKLFPLRPGFADNESVVEDDDDSSSSSSSSRSSTWAQLSP